MPLPAAGGHPRGPAAPVELVCVAQGRVASAINGYIAQRLERLTADQQVPGSNPGVPSLFCVVNGSVHKARIMTRILLTQGATYTLQAHFGNH